MLILSLAINWILAAVLLPLDGRRPWVGWLAVVGLATSGLSLIGLGARVLRDGPVDVVTGGWPVGVGIRLHADVLSVTFAGLAVGLLLAALVHEVLGGVEARAFPAVVLFLAAGLTGLFLTGDVFNFYVFFEVAMTASFVLTGYGGGPRQIRNALTFMVVNLLGSVLFLSGVGALYHVTGTLDMRPVAVRAGATEPQPVVLAAVLFFVAFGVKLGLFPFHFWLPPVYRGARPAVAAVLSGVLATIGSYGLLRFGAGVLPRELELGRPVVLGLGAASVLYGALLAVARRPARDVLAYSSISQAGFILLGLGAGGTAGYAAAVLYAVVNAVNKTLLFLSIGRRGPVAAFAFAVGGFSTAGIPPAVGFFGKAAVFRAGVTAESATLIAVAFLGGALSVVYMFQAFQREFWAGKRAEATGPRAAQLPVLALTAVVLALGVWPEPLLDLSQRVARALLGGSL